MNEPVNSLFDILIGVLVITLCMGIYIPLVTGVMDTDNLGFGVLSEKTILESNMEKDPYDRYSAYDRYQIATVGLVNDYTQEFFVGAVSYPSSEHFKVTNDGSLRQYWLKMRNIWGSGGANTPVTITRRMMPIQAFKSMGGVPYIRKTDRFSLLLRNDKGDLFFHGVNISS